MIFLENERYHGSFYYGAGNAKLMCHWWTAGSESVRFVQARTSEGCIPTQMGEVRFKDDQNGKIPQVWHCKGV